MGHGSNQRSTPRTWHCVNSFTIPSLDSTKISYFTSRSPSNHLQQASCVRTTRSCPHQTLYSARIWVVAILHLGSMRPSRLTARHRLNVQMVPKRQRRRGRRRRARRSTELSGHRNQNTRPWFPLLQIEQVKGDIFRYVFFKNRIRLSNKTHRQHNSERNSTRELDRLGDENELVRTKGDRRKVNFF